MKRVAVDAGGSGDTATDTGTEDVATDAATDTGSEDVATDAAEDTAPDAGEDTATDAEVDTATDTATDAGEVCGNGVIESGETCDDGNTVTEQCAYGDRSCTVCNAACQGVAGAATFCGNGLVDGAEFCDDGNTSNADACNNSCSCGSGYHAEGDICLSDVQACSPLPANTTAGTQTWNSGSGSYGPCTATACASGYSVSGGVCVLSSYSLGTACTLNADCASGFCATGPAGTANDRCAPPGMNYIPAGTFSMGSPSGEVGHNGNETQHSVTLTRSFFIGQTEVTQGQWKALSGGINPSFHQNTTCTYLAGCASTENANDSGPAEQMDWYAAVAFANAKSAAEGLTSCYTLTGCADAANGWKDGVHSSCTGATFAGLTCTGYRLPTESEWEYAARGGTTTATYLGNLSGGVDDCTTAQANLDGIAWWCRNSGNRTKAVGGKTANSFGLSDMLGNVWEWTGDWYNATYPGTVTDPLGASTGSYRVIRGGSWSNYARRARAANRFYAAPVGRNYLIGFRLSRTAP